MHAIGYGLIEAGIMGLAATGLSLQVSVTNFINFAYGDYLALGGYFALAALRLGLNMYLATIFAMICVAIFGFLSYKGLYGPLKDRGMKVFSLLIVSVGLSLLLESVVAIFWGPTQQNYGLQGSAPLHVGPFLFTAVQLEIIVFAIVTLGALDLFLRFTKVGKGMRAMADNMNLARVSGINTDALTGAVWTVMGAMAGLAGVMLAITVSSFSPSYGFTFLFLIFAVVIIGGIGKIYGTMVGALIVGVGISIAQAYIAVQYSDAIIFAILIGTLLVKPQGLFGGKMVVQ